MDQKYTFKYILFLNPALKIFFKDINHQVKYNSKGGNRTRWVMAPTHPGRRLKFNSLKRTISLKKPTWIYQVSRPHCLWELPQRNRLHDNQIQYIEHYLHNLISPKAQWTKNIKGLTVKYYFRMRRALYICI